MRILILSSFFPPNVGGAETHLADLCRYLVERGNQIDVLTYKPLNTRIPAPRLERSEGMKIRRIDWPANGLFYKLENNALAELLYLAPMLFWFAALSLLRRHDKPDVIHSHGLTATAAGVALAKIFRIRNVSSLHTIYRLDKRKIFSISVRFLLTRTNKILVPSDACKTDLEAVGISPKQIEVYTNWVDQIMFRPRDKEESRKSIGLPLQRRVILFVGRLIESKGVLHLLSVAKRLPEYTVAFVGDGPLRESLEHAANEYPNIIFLGKKFGLELARIYNCADIFWGSADEDCVGRVTIEGLSSGVPVILPDRLTIFGVERPVSVHLPGASVTVKVDSTPDQIASQLRELLENPDMGQLMSKNSRETALSLYSENNAAIIERSYHVS